ncbi:MAG: bifunctional diaminohydroxyphosphoribosylaminopyrimidine deaminase/5-amino-6-(5-phosphoribosylamino)uracil reductase RibD [Dehalococcoidia bacterium]|nr:bifunctional diaminohydroxyphosphoribosylaminopyrimidine deaminase/5-amino-6-(5-phosphoribosylamino)uracil reductase RibD [Dehalococcoidia bacterium]
MQRALRAAAAVRGQTRSNPWVGAVLVRDDVVVGEGATAPPGGVHAEAAAIAATGGRGGTLYVTLEPCVPFAGKRTRACVEAIVAAGVERVVVGIPDPDARVQGRGIAWLRERGVTVEVGDGEREVEQQLRPYLKHRSTGRPYVVAKFAASLDGRIATASGDSRWITGEAARERSHQERARVDAILVGSGTVLADDPALTARPGGVLAERQPLRVVVDARGRVPLSARLFDVPPVILATTRRSSPEWRRGVVACGAEVIECAGTESGVDLDQLLEALAQRGVITVWAEGGGTLLGALFRDGQVDELWAFLAPVVIGGDGKAAVAGPGTATVAEAWRLEGTVVESLERDILVRGYVRGR